MPEIGLGRLAQRNAGVKTASEPAVSFMRGPLLRTIGVEMHVYRRLAGSGRHNTGARTRHHIFLFSIAANLFLLILVPGVWKAFARTLASLSKGRRGGGRSRVPGWALIGEQGRRRE